MPNLITKTEAARRRDVSLPAVSQALKNGQLVQTTGGKIDAEHPLNRHWLETPARQHPKRTARKKKEAESGNQSPQPTSSRRPPREPEQTSIPGIPDGFDPAQKLYEETRWKKAQADLKALEYAEKLGVINDDVALDRKFGKFADFLLNDLIYFPEESGELLWAEASSSEDPVATLTNALKTRIAKIIEDAQAAAREVLPGDGAVKYTFTDTEDE